MAVLLLLAVTTVLPRVAVVMGSDSDLPTMEPAAAILRELGVSVEVRVLSAHRTPLEMVTFAQGARDQGFGVIVAGAGGAAHLPGMVAALTTLPVIGVPVQSRALSGVDSLHSIVQMPGGIPVATVAIGGGLNAGLLAAQILSVAMGLLGFWILWSKRNETPIRMQMEAFRAANPPVATEGAPDDGLADAAGAAEE